ncbi:hypothetical protein NDU88_002489 [Pleurodeles waltl]|uniref:Uncharacterized protein n=1 Tax=Pleurodeles waltl TaxID=8319 RepID=A0AAV7LKD9_PLEWA|nr:hypothetical protein NDU88_002489 [Pleurodeles waltl]
MEAPTRHEEGPGSLFCPGITAARITRLLGASVVPDSQRPESRPSCSCVHGVPTRSRSPPLPAPPPTLSTASRALTGHRSARTIQGSLRSVPLWCLSLASTASNDQVIDRTAACHPARPRRPPAAPASPAVLRATEVGVRGVRHTAPPLTGPFNPLLPANTWEASASHTSCLRPAPASCRGALRYCGPTQEPLWYQ